MLGEASESAGRLAERDDARRGPAKSACAAVRRVCWSARIPVLAAPYPMLLLRRDPLKLLRVHERRPPLGAVPDRGDSRLRPCVGSPARISRFVLFDVQTEAA